MNNEIFTIIEVGAILFLQNNFYTHCDSLVATIIISTLFSSGLASFLLLFIIDPNFPLYFVMFFQL